MNTEPGMVPWSCSSCSRTSTNVAWPRRRRGEGGGGVGAQRRAHRQEHVGAGGGGLGALEVGGDEVLAEGDGGRLQHPAALEARGVLVAGPHAVEGLRHRAAPSALE